MARVAAQRIRRITVTHHHHICVTAPNTLGRQELGSEWQTTQRGMGKENQEGVLRNNTLGKESLNIWELCTLTQLLCEKVQLHEGVRIQS